MSFLTNIFTRANPTPANPSTGTEANITDIHNRTKADNEWDIVSPEEATGYYIDRITLLLGPNNTAYPLLLTSVSNTSSLLTNLATFEPSQRYAHLPALTAEMLELYLEQAGSEVLVKSSWLNIIKLAITAEVLEDVEMERRAIAALKRRGVPLFDHHDFAFARAYQNSTGAGRELMQTLEDIMGRGAVRSRLPRTKEPVSRLVQTKSNGEKYGKSVLRDNMFSIAKRPDPDKEVASRQPRVPPSVEALRSGVVGNFAWEK